MNIFVIFLWICSGESTKVLFSPSATNIEGEVLSCLVQVRCFQLTLSEAITCEDWGREKTHKKVANFFYSIVLQLVDVTNQRGEKLKRITGSLSKRKTSTAPKKEDKNKTNKLNLNKIKQN